MASEESQRIRASFNTSAPPAAPVPLDVERKQWEDAALQAHLPANTTIEAQTIEGITCEWVWSEGAEASHALLYLHGGGFNAGSCKTHRDLAAFLSQASAVPVLLIDYRLAPENPFPAGLDDVMTIYRWLLDHDYTADQIVIGGDSAGAGLALSALLAARDAKLPMPRAAVFLSPWFDLMLTGKTLISRAAVDPMVTRDALQEAAQMYIGSADPANPLISPVYADLKGLPPCLIHSGDHEVLQSDAQCVADSARAAGVDVQLTVWPEMWHVWHSWAATMPEAQQAIAQIGAFVRERMQR